MNIKVGDRVKLLRFKPGTGNDDALTIGDVYEVVSIDGPMYFVILPSGRTSSYVYLEEVERVGSKINRNLPEWW
jgi:hypothetical protein